MPIQDDSSVTAPESPTLRTAHCDRIDQWHEISPMLEISDQLTRVLANAEAVLGLASTVVGLLGTDDAERDFESPALALSHGDRANLSAGLEAATRMALTQLDELHRGARDRLERSSPP